MELRLELALSSSPVRGSDPNQDCDRKKKRSFHEAFLGVEKNVDLPPTLPLLIWDESKWQTEILPFSNRNAEVKDEIVVGWPPVKSWRKQLCHHNRRECATNYVNVENSGGGSGGGGGGGVRGSNSMYVKVKMEGVGIIRKVDLSAHHSYYSLAAKLVAMFGKCEENVEEYKIIFQNKEGDWLHTRDVPWETFIKSVQRLKLGKMAIDCKRLCF